VWPTANASFVDTNVLVYSADPDAGAKHDAALALLELLRDSGSLVVSVQVLNEFYSVATRPMKPPALSHTVASEMVYLLASAATVVPLTASLTFLALDAMPNYGFSFWDALIWAAAREAGATVLYSEDFQNDRTVEGVRFIDPFVAASQS
jgi:predicted nucleic acid-binding protein